MPDESEKPDAIEIWAKRLGRAFGFVALGGLALYLLLTYGPR
jgi:hypothetical protein